MTSSGPESSAGLGPFALPSSGQLLDDVSWRSVEGGAKQSYQSVLTRMVETVSHDNAQLRQLIYEFARIRLRKDLYREFHELGWTGIAERVLALEAAIDQVESDLAHNAAMPSLFSELAPSIDRSREASRGSALVVPEATKETIRAGFAEPIPASFLRSGRYDLDRGHDLSPVSEHRDRSATGWTTKRPRSRFWWTIQVLAAVMVGIAIYAAADRDFVLGMIGSGLSRLQTVVKANTTSGALQQGASSGSGATPKSRAESQFAGPGFPLPSSYGVYAINNGKLTELDVLPIRIPDPRIALSAAITTPSRAHLAAGHVEFVVFRRDLERDAPDRAFLRVIAQVTRDLSFDSAGHPITTNVEGSWLVRSNSYQMSVAPVPDHQEMILIRSDDPKSALPAGRYALVLKGVAYDFTLDGPVSDAAHCLERTDAVNVPVYSECRNP